MPDGMPRTLYGNNTAVWNGDTLLSDTTTQRLNTAGISILRFPGGSTSDQYHWDGQYPAYAQAQGWANMSQPWAVSTAEYMKLVQKLGSIPVITANYGYATYDTTATDGNVANAAQLAADLFFLLANSRICALWIAFSTAGVSDRLMTRLPLMNIVGLS